MRSSGVSMTIAEIAEKLGVEKKPAYALVQFLLAVDLAELRGVRKAALGRGKGENVYALSDDVDEALAQTVRTLRA